MRHVPKLFALAGLVIVAAAAAGCGSTTNKALDDSLAALDARAAPPSLSPNTPEPKCSHPTWSLRPPAALPTPGHMPAGTFMRELQDRGYLIAGVDQNTLFLSYLDPFKRSLQGLEIDLLRRLAKAIFGKTSAIRFETPTTSTDRIAYVEDGKVDAGAGAITIDCGRLQDVAFSSVYYQAAQRVLVPTNSPAHVLNALAGKRVCARAGTTTYARLAELPFHVIRVPVQVRTDCLVDLQEGKVDAISADDTILLGFQKQDPYTRLLPGSLEPEPYGIAIRQSHPDFVRFVNGVLARMRADGELRALDRKWLGSAAQPVPPAKYKD
jgi:polar amino acid transport system substrate-binding protein